jgi:hypothetical protein
MVAIEQVEQKSTRLVQPRRQAQEKRVYAPFNLFAFLHNLRCTELDLTVIRFSDSLI